MRKVIRKWFFAWDYDKEEKWLNEMAAKGLGLVAVGFCRYEFEDCEPGEYKYKLEMLEHGRSHPETQKYIAFLEETGVDHLGFFSKWSYFRRKSCDGEFDLFSDFDSKIKHLKRIQMLMFPIGILGLIIGIQNLYFFFTHHFAGNTIGFVNILLSLLLMFGVYRIEKKKKKLKKDRQIFE